MKSNNFEQLPAELINLVLLELPTTQLLHSLIRASPKSYQVFLASKEKILVSLMRRTIRPAAFIDALAAVQASQLKERGPDRKTVLAFLRKYENKRHKAVEQKGQHYSVRTAVSLCQLYRSTQYFIKDLTGRSNFYLRRCRDFMILREKGSGVSWRSFREPVADRDHRYTPLSSTEESRLQRAFYRYELYTHIFSSDMEYSGEKLWELPLDSHFFLARYKHWEIEELACVENYLWSLLSNSFDRIELKFVGIQLPAPPLNEESSRESLYSYSAVSRPVALREAKYQIHSLYAEYLLNLSLPFLHYALRLDRLNMQRQMSSHIYYDGQRRSLSTALEEFWKELSCMERHLIQDYNDAVTRSDRFEFKDTTDKPNEGWLCVYRNTQLISPNTFRHITQGLGYVFWDSQRLRKSGLWGPRLFETIAQCRIRRNNFPSTTAPVDY